MLDIDIENIGNHKTKNSTISMSNKSERDPLKNVGPNEEGSGRGSDIHIPSHPSLQSSLEMN